MAWFAYFFFSILFYPLQFLFVSFSLVPLNLVAMSAAAMLATHTFAKYGGCIVDKHSSGGNTLNMRANDDIYKQIQDAKDLHHLSLVGSYNAAHLLHGFPPHFLHPAVTSANSASNPFSSSGGAFVKPFPSAFAPPTKCVGLGLEQVRRSMTPTTASTKPKKNKNKINYTK